MRWTREPLSVPTFVYFVYIHSICVCVVYSTVVIVCHNVRRSNETEWLNRSKMKLSLKTLMKFATFMKYFIVFTISYLYQTTWRMYGIWFSIVNVRKQLISHTPNKIKYSLAKIIKTTFKTHIYVRYILIIYFYQARDTQNVMLIYLKMRNVKNRQL